jgi:hypothetical protein
MLLGVTDSGADLILLESERTLQHHLDGRAYVEEEVVRVQEQGERSDGSDGSADHGTDDRVFRDTARRGDT